MGLLQIDILGTSFSIKASESDEYLKKLLKYYKKITNQIEKSGMMKNTVHISILAGIMLCDELYKEKSKSAKLLHRLNSSGSSYPEEIEAEKITAELIKKLDDALIQ